MEFFKRQKRLNFMIFTSSKTRNIIIFNNSKRYKVARKLFNLLFIIKKWLYCHIIPVVLKLVCRSIFLSFFVIFFTENCFNLNNFYKSFVYLFQIFFGFFSLKKSILKLEEICYFIH